MFVLNSWHYFKLQFLCYYNLFRRVLPFLTQRMAPWNIKLSLEPQSNSYNFFPFSSSECRPALPEAWAPANAGAHAEPLYFYKIGADTLETRADLGLRNRRFHVRLLPNFNICGAPCFWYFLQGFDLRRVSLKRGRL